MEKGDQDRRLNPPSLVVERHPWRVTIVDDELVDVSWQGVRLLSGVRALARDRDWLTVPNRVEKVDVVEAGGSTEVTIDVAAAGLGIDLSMAVVARIDSESLEISFTGRANSAFESNRIGFVVLHPPDVSGTPIAIEHTGGETSDSQFPDLISPHQPFQDIAAMRWGIDGVEARLEYHGDVFETEDQRNWTDASFKTYSRPLDLPFPFPVGAGEVLEQKLVLTAGAASGWAPPASVAVADRIVVGGPTGAVVPAISTSARREGSSGSIAPDLRLPSLLVEIDTASQHWPAVLELAIADAQLLGAAIDLRLALANPDEGDEVLDRVGDVPLQRVAVVDRTSHVTEALLWDWLAKRVGSFAAAPDLVAGTRAHFTELNRTQHRISPVLAGADGVTFSLTPQMHSTEIRHIVSSLGAQQDVIKSARAFLGAAPVHVGPITLESRFNAVATSKSGAAATVPPDPLTRTPFAAAWAIGSVAALSKGGVASLSYFRVSELRGTEAGALIARLAPLSGLPVLSVDGADDPGLAVLAVSGDDGAKVFLGNLSGSARRLTVEGPAGDGTQVGLAPWSFDVVDCSGTS